MKKISSIKMPVVALVLSMMVVVPVAAAIIVQNFTRSTVVVDDPPIVKEQGADADYDGDGDDTTGYLQVKLGETISNNDSGLGTPGTNNTLLSNEQITFTCFAGDRTFYTDVLQLRNTTTESWNVTLTGEADLAGNAAVADTFTAGDADIWVFTSAVDSTTAVTQIPNPNNYGSLTDWYDSASPNGAIQYEVVAGVMSVAASNATGPITIPAGEQRQVAMVVDCGSNMVDTETGTFRITVGMTPA